MLKKGGESVKLPTHVLYVSEVVQEINERDNVVLDNPIEKRTRNIDDGLVRLSSVLVKERGYTAWRDATHIGDNFVHHIPVQNEALWTEYVDPDGLLFLPPVLRQTRASQA